MVLFALIRAAIKCRQVTYKYIKLMGSFFAYLGTKTFRNNVLYAIGFVIAILIIIFYSLSFYTRHGEGIPVPKLKGLQVEEAVELLKSQGFRYEIDSVYLMDKTPGMVVEQDPDPNTNVKQNRFIYLTIITRSAPDVNFPDVEGKTFLEARAILNNFGLKVGDTSYVSDVAKDVILKTSFGGQAIAKGEKIPKGSKLDLVLGDGLGASEVDIPNLVGLNISEARIALMGSSLVLGNITYEGTITDSTSIKILKQFPALSDSVSKVSIGTPIDVVLSNE